MKHVLTLLACVTLGTSAYSQADKLGSLTSNINIEGLETQFNPETGVATAVGEVHIKYQGVEISAGRADYNSNTGDVIAKENVVIIKEGSIFRGENVLYNVNTKEIKANNLSGGMAPLYYNTSDVKVTEGDVKKIEGSQAYFTTHDSETPNYHMKARTMTIYPNDRIVMHDVKVYIGEQAVFWFPVYVQPLDDELGYFFKPGYASQWGAFLLNQYGAMYGDHTLAKYMLDLRSERGIAGGVSLKSLRFKDNELLGNILLYYAYDTAPTTGIGHEQRSDVKKDRYRIDLQHRIYLPGPKESTWYLDFDITKLSDEFMLEDYYLNEFRTNPQPDNTIKLVKHSDDFTATLWGRFQVNKFFHTDTRLPELAFDFTRQPLFKSNVYYQGETSLGIYRDKLSESEQSTLLSKIKTQSDALKSLVDGGSSATLLNADGSKQTISALAGTTLVANDSNILRTSIPKLLLNRDQVEADLEALKAELAENKFFRFHTYHEFLYPVSFGSNNWLTIVPRLGGGASYYSDVAGGPKNIGSDTQPIFHAGLDISGRFSREFSDVQSRRWGLDGLRHVIQPYVNYSYLSADAIDGLPSIDRLTPSTRPRPIDVPLYTAIDSLNTWNVARVGVRNVLQTKRDGVTLNWMGMNSFVDYFFQDPEFNRSISNLYNDFYWNPLPWLGFTIDSQLPLGSSEFNFTEVNTGINWMPSKNFSWMIGHQYISHHPLFVNSSLIYSRIYTRLNDNWGFSMNHVYEMDDGTLQYQSYGIHRDLASWAVELGGLIRNNGGGSSNEIGIVMSFTLKDFPSISIPLDLDPNPTGYGGRQ